MKFSLAKGPYLRSKRTTTGIMLELFAVLCVVWLTSIVAYSVRFNVLVGLRGMLVGLVSIVTTLVIDVIMALVNKERTIKGICKFVLNSYSYVTALIFALCLPIGVDLYVVVIGAIVATLLGKYVFGGFGYNIFNPAIIGRIFVGLSFPNKMNYGIEPRLFDSANYDFVSGSTVTGSINWSNGVIPDGYNLKQLLFGNYNGAMGETFTILLVVAAIYLIIRGIVNYRLVVSYLLTITGISFFLGLFYNVSNVFNYTLMHLVTGGLMFGAVFMISDPVTSPKSMNGKVIFGICTAGLTMLIRVKSSYPEGVMFSIALMNMLNPLIDSCIKGNTFSKQFSRWAIIVSFFVGVIGVNVGFNALYPLEGKSSEEDNNAWLSDYTVNKVSDSVYEVSSEAFHGKLKMGVTLDTINNKVIKVVVLEVDDHENNYNGIDSLTYYSAYVGDNLNLSFEEFDAFVCSNKLCNKVSDSLTSFDVEAGSTYTSSAVIGNIKAVIETYRGGAN